ncbi:hypothetical protein GW17_00044024 [Ensete ventricosum]|nr:hypothetical protein GW17_00044024 [Ensete ventricosum]
MTSRSRRAFASTRDGTPEDVPQVLASGFFRLVPRDLTKRTYLILEESEEGDHQRLARKGQPATASPAVSRGGASRRGGRPLAGRLSTAKGSHRLCRGSGAVRVKEG